MRELIIYLFVFSFFLCFGEKVAFYNYAINPGTDTIVFNGNVGEFHAEVYIDYSQIFLVSGSDGNRYHCWKVVGTGATYKMGLVYFSWSGVNTYICNDGKRRGYAKLDAGGWIQFDSSEFSGPCLNAFSEGENFWHSADGMGNGTGYGFSDGIGLWNRNYVSIQTGNVRNKIWYWIDLNKSIIYINNGKIADGADKANFYLVFKDGQGNLINGLWINEIGFTGVRNIFFVNGKSGLFFSGLKSELTGIYLLDHGKFMTGVYSVLPYSGNFSIWVGWSGNGLILTNTTYFNIPLNIKLSIYDKNGDGKILLGNEEKGYLFINSLVNNIKNISVLGKFQFSGNGSYKAYPGSEIYSTGYFDLNVHVVSKYVDNKLPVFYKVSGKYDIVVNGRIYTGVPFTGYTNYVYFYPDKNVEKLLIIGNCYYVTGDGQSICKLKVKLKNKENYNIPFLKIGKLKIKDLNKNLADSYPYRTFDIDEVSSNYITGVFLSGFDSISDNYGDINMYIYSYKPIFNGSLGVSLYDLSGISEDVYNWYQSYNSGKKVGLMFKKAVDIYFSGNVLENGILLGSDNKIKVVFRNLVYNISSGSYMFSGILQGCTGCKFETGGLIVSNTFGNQTVNIVISGTQEPQYVTYYDKYYQFYVSGLSGLKQVKLKPNIRINGKSLTIIGQTYGSKVLGLVSKAILTEATKVRNVAIIGSKIPFSNFVGYIERLFYVSTRGVKMKTNWDLSNKYSFNNFKGFYDCGGKVVILGDGNNDIIIYGRNKLFLKDCQLLINSNIVKGESDAKLQIISISSGGNSIDVLKDDGWRFYSNIYISSNVSEIEADLMTDGSIFSLSGDKVSIENIFFPYRRRDDNIKRQLYIHGKILSRNTIGGGCLDVNGKVTLPGGRRYEPDLKGVFILNNIDASTIAQAYDINFWRANLVNFGYTNYDTGLIASIILKKYNCQGDINKDVDICYMPVVVEYDR